ncbi:MAG: hypothetical protein A2Y24_04490 [Clostridiales bacterium GWE2_32_10]|nr:MAG: hypothetical protein A2Y24_04490 [Clostridiales bacterium GWE2_32_10]HBY20919.1 hypothetical protein [Clostridiales bacterium]
MKKNITYILPLIGDLEILKEELATTLEMLTDIKNYIHLIVVIDNKNNEKHDFINLLKSCFSDVNIIASDNETNLFSTLYNKALGKVTTDYVYLGIIGNVLSIQQIQSFLSIYATNECKVFYFERAILDVVYSYPYSALCYGWLLCHKIFELTDLIISIDIFKKIGYFDKSKILQKYFDWDFYIKICRNYDFEGIPIPPNDSVYNFINYPYTVDYKISKDISHRYLLRKDSENREKIFMLDLSVNNKPCYKIAILQEGWGYVHSQLCFLNFLDMLYGTGFATYKVLFSFDASILDIEDSDLVIFVRCSHCNILNIISYCNNHNIKSLYMIDDNWIRIAKEWPKLYANMFIPRGDEYDVFLQALKACTAVLVYNKYLKKDIEPYANKVYTLPININLDFFPNYKQDNTDIIIGYAGTPRFNEEAFRALSEIGRENKNIRILLFGILKEDDMKYFEGIDIIRLPYMSYINYCEEISKISPHILVAPLDNSIASMSKCANKYLEITAANSVGVYSDLYPYSEVIKDNYNGILVHTNTEDEWKERIYYLLNNKDIFDNIRKNAREDLEKKYTTKVVMKRFKRLICNIITIKPPP